MNILPVQLIGKTVKDCYERPYGVIVIEFTDGSKIEIDSKTFVPKHVGGKERYIDLKLE